MSPRGSTAGESSSAKMLTILELVLSAETPLSLAEIARRAELTKPTAHRLLQMLVERNYVRRTTARTYATGARALWLAGETLAQVNHSEMARPALRRLHDLIPETVHFAVLSGNDVVYVEKFESRRPYRMASSIGMSLPLHCTAIGKSLLAFMPAEERSRLLPEGTLPARTRNTITARDKLEGELARVARRGYAMDDEENEENIRCIGAAVFDKDGVPIGGVSVSAPSFQLSALAARRMAPAIVATAREISLALAADLERLPAAYRPARRRPSGSRSSVPQGPSRR
ncbi:MAG: IclR family transcriptional regulator, acetate operon repressor [Chloroflexota bacterium]|nr:IclR family transcriptional regulator, acetate operon repressor [Chloroflexota bacterium]